MDFGAKSVLLMMAFLNQVHKAFKLVFVKDILKCFFSNFKTNISECEKHDPLNIK